MTRVPSELRLPLHSTLLATLAFNLVFFVQELFLVLPKALTPGLNPTLYHITTAGRAITRWRRCGRAPARPRPSSSRSSCSCSPAAARTARRRRGC
ncbi:hypothetical protein [Allosphingosinicella indica]|uniref:hypothetical protein n=1 Tax=Allosphingosinicella indica TaxID=941907 RepID=UPI0012F4C574|nr:hypothetical protein [Allosphingosinicella indica]